MRKVPGVATSRENIHLYGANLTESHLNVSFRVIHSRILT